MATRALLTRKALRGNADPSTSTYQRMLACPNERNHSYGPVGYLAWHEWAEQVGPLCDVSECPGCGLWLIWTPKREGSGETVRSEESECRS